MPTTTPRGYSYLLPGDPPDLAAATQALATTADAEGQARHLIRASSLSLANNPALGSAVVSAYDSSLINVGSLTYSAGVLTVNVAGVYLWSASVGFASSSTGYKSGAGININGTASLYGQELRLNNVAQSSQLGASGVVPLAVGDQVQLWLYQNSGAALTVNPYSFGLTRLA